MSERLTPAGLMWRMALRPSGTLLARILLLVMVSFALAGTVLTADFVAGSALRGEGRLGADLMVVTKGTDLPPGAPLLGGVPGSSSLPAGVAERLAAMPGVRGVTSQYCFISPADSCCEAGDLLLVGFDPSRDLTVFPWLRDGMGLKGTERPVLVGWRVLKAPGAPMRFYNQTFTVASRLGKSGNNRFDSAIFIPFDGLRGMERSSQGTGVRPFRVAWGNPSLLLARLQPSADPSKISADLERLYPGIRVLSMAETLRHERGRLARLARWTGPVAATAWTVALLTGAALNLLLLRERQQFLGLLRAFRCGRTMIVLMFGAEAFVVALAAMTVGGGVAYAAFRSYASELAAVLDLPFLSAFITLQPSGGALIGGLFAGGMAVEAMAILLFLVRREPAELLGGAR